jgi:hypothetical protein
MTNLPMEDIIRLIPIPLICIMGMITNGLNTAVFLNSKMKNTTFKFMLAISINDFFYLLFDVCIAINYCKNCSSIKNSYVYNLFLLYIEDYLTSCMAIFSILANIILSLHRFCIITNKKYWIWTKHKWIIFSILIISILYYLPVIFFKKKSNENIHNFIYNDETSEYIHLALHVFRIFLNVFVLSILNIVNVVQYKKMNSNKLLIKNMAKRSTLETNQSLTANFKETKSNRRISVMVFLICLISFIGSLPYFLVRVFKIISVENPIFQINLIATQEWLNDFELFGDSILLLSHSVSIFVYFNYNTIFNSLLVKYFCKNSKNKINSELSNKLTKLTFQK